MTEPLSTPAAQGTVAGWNYDLDKQPNGLHEVAFDGGLGICNVRICERYISGPTLIDGSPVPVKDYQYAYREEYGDGWRDVNTRNWRPYAWRHIVVPPLSAPSPEALPASGVEAVLYADLLAFVAEEAKSNPVFAKGHGKVRIAEARTLVERAKALSSAPAPEDGSNA